MVACGDPRQDKGEPKRNFRASANLSFPQKQTLAKRSHLVIKVRNEENRATIPNVAVTVLGFDTRTKQQDVSDPSRPMFVINARPAKIGTFPETKEAGPDGGETAYVSTWTLGPLKAGATKTFRWDVTAVKAGKYKLSYRVSAGLNGRARAVSTTGGPVKGVMSGRVSDAAPASRIADDGKTVVEGTR